MTNFQIPMVETAESTLVPTAEKAVFSFGHWTLEIGHSRIIRGPVHE
jgi:hypothetical protein